jgi:hypothetical protein
MNRQRPQQPNTSLLEETLKSAELRQRHHLPPAVIRLNLLH